MLRHRLAIAVLCLCPCAFAADTISHHAIVNGGGTVASGNLRLDYSIGQPVAGSVGHCGITLHSGYQALVSASAPNDRIFGNGFDSNACTTNTGNPR